MQLLFFLQKRMNLSEKSEHNIEELKNLQDKLNKSEQDQVSLRQRLTDIEKELQASLEEWATFNIYQQ